MFFVSFFAPFVRSFLPEDFCCTEFADGPYLSVGRSVTGRMIRGPIGNSLLLRVQHWWSGIVFWTVRHSSRTVRWTLTDSPPGGRGRSAQALRTVRPVLADSPAGPVLRC
jgi:hypothetical protein